MRRETPLIIGCGIKYYPSTLLRRGHGGRILNALANCPLLELELSGEGFRNLSPKEPLHGALAAVRMLRLNCDAYSASFLESLAGVVVSLVEGEESSDVGRGTRILLRYILLLFRQTLDLSGSKNFSVASFKLFSLRCLRAVNLTGCVHLSAEAILSLPSTVTSIGLGSCKHLNIDDAFLGRVSISNM